MSRLAYMSQTVQMVAPKIEQHLRKEIGADAPLAFAVENGEVGKASLGSLIGDLGAAFVGGKGNVLFHLNFQLPQPRPANLRVSVDRQGLGSYVGLLLYSTWLLKPVGSEISLEEPKSLSFSNFVGDAMACAKLNANKSLIKRINWFACTEAPMGPIKLKIRRLCKIIPNGNSSLFVVATLPRPTWMGFGSTASAKDFFDIAATIEATL
jgi:hypothetical protein